MTWLQVPLSEVQTGDTLKFAPAYTCRKCKRPLAWGPKHEACSHCGSYPRYDDWKAGKPRFYVILKIEGDLAKVADQEWILMTSPQITFGRKTDES